MDEMQKLTPKIKDFIADIRSLSNRKIAEKINDRFNVKVSHVAVGNYKKSLTSGNLPVVSKKKKSIYSDEVRQQGYAQGAIQRAILKGDLVRPTECEICKEDTKHRVEGHHPDYSKPLDVVWLCQSCHSKLHRMKMPSSLHEFNILLQANKDHYFYPYLNAMIFGGEYKGRHYTGKLKSDLQKLLEFLRDVMN